MTHRLIILITIVAAALTAVAQRLQDPAVGRIMCSEPGNVLADVTPNLRAELLAYYIGGTKVEKDNDMGEKCGIDTVTDQYLRLHTSVSREVQMRLLVKGKHKGDTVVAVIETVKTPIPDSRLTFYDTQWNPAQAKRVVKEFPSIDAFYRTGIAKDAKADTEQRIDFAVISLDFEGKDFGTLVARQRLQEFYSKDDYAKIGKSLYSTLTYSIVGSRLQKISQQ